MEPVISGRLFFSDGTSGDDEYRGYIEYDHSSNYMRFGTNATERIRLTSAGKIGVGSNNPARFVHVLDAGSSNVVNVRIQQESSNTATDGGALLELGGTRSDGTYGFYGGIKGGRRNQSADNKGYLAFFADDNDGQSMSERMRLNHQGQLLVGTDFTTATVSTSVQFRVRNGLGGHIAEFNRTDNVDGNNRDLISFRRGSAGSVGSITASNSAVQYNTSSDYRLKRNVVLISDGITRVKQLKPSRFNFIVNPGVTVDGFLAHEAATVVPESVIGTHNEVDSENNPVYQGIDQSKNGAIVDCCTAGSNRKDRNPRNQSCRTGGLIPSIFLPNKYNRRKSMTIRCLSQD